MSQHNGEHDEGTWRQRVASSACRLAIQPRLFSPRTGGWSPLSTPAPSRQCFLPTPSPSHGGIWYRAPDGLALSGLTHCWHSRKEAHFPCVFQNTCSLLCNFSALTPRPQWSQQMNKSSNLLLMHIKGASAASWADSLFTEFFWQPRLLTSRNSEQMPQGRGMGIVCLQIRMLSFYSMLTALPRKHQHHTMRRCI